ncbi:MAG: hypothetical protein J5802_10185 [Butyrivibrio sp.]|nr:hypothetical protein [Butyrivibrio sp.]
MNKIRVIFAIVSCVVLVGLCGCGTAGGENENSPMPNKIENNGEGTGLYIKEGLWSSGGHCGDNEYTYSDLKAGDEIYNDWDSVITVKSVDDEKVVLSIDGCFVEPNEDGSINLNKQPLKKLTINRGETVEIETQTMDAGAKLEISYE